MHRPDQSARCLEEVRCATCTLEPARALARSPFRRNHGADATVAVSTVSYHEDQEIRMATTHTPSRRQRPPRRTTASTAHARNRSAGARQNRTAPEPSVAEPPVWDEKILETKVEEVLVAKAARPIRTPDSDDHLAAYFRQLAEHELLTP